MALRWWTDDHGRIKMLTGFFFIVVLFLKLYTFNKNTFVHLYITQIKIIIRFQTIAGINSNQTVYIDGLLNSLLIWFNVLDRVTSTEILPAL